MNFTSALRRSTACMNGGSSSGGRQSACGEDVVFAGFPCLRKACGPRPADDRGRPVHDRKEGALSEGGPVGVVKYAARWNIVPADTAAYLRGELTDPVRLITMVMDPNMPETARAGEARHSELE